MNIKYCISLALLLCYTGLLFGSVTMELESSKVRLGQTFNLTLTMEDSTTNAQPDLTPLERDFNIVGTEHSMNYSIFNGQSHSVSQWTILLVAKRIGIFTIPSLRIGSEQSNVGLIEVTKSTLSSSTTKADETQINKDIFLETEVNESEPYVNQQVIYTVRLFNSQRLLNASYQPPDISEGLLIPLGEGRRYQSTLNGRFYAVEEQHYAVFPQKSGELKIKAPVFHATIYDVLPRQTVVQAKSKLLHVKPKPLHNKIYWLPAKQVSLEEQIDKESLSMIEGATFVRKITLKVTAVPAQLLPKLEFANSTEYSVYPQKSIEQNEFKDGNIVGTVVFNLTYLLNQAGEITLPEQKVFWFNTVTQKEEFAMLPARTIHVTASTVHSSNQVRAATLNNVPLKTATQTAKNINWTAIGFALAWLLTLGAWWWHRKLPTLLKKPTLKKTPKQRKALQEACLSDNPIKARDALLDWARQQWPEQSLLNLADIEKLIDDPLLKQQIIQLSEVLYQLKQGKIWKGDELWTCITRFKKSKKKEKINSHLSTL